jgi:signal transduction histidine kinase
MNLAIRQRAPLGRLRRASVTTQDALFAAALCVLDLGTQWDEHGERMVGEGPLPWPVIPVYAVAGYAALTWRRRNPQLVFAVLVVHNLVAQVLLPYRPTLGLIVAFYTLASRSGLRVSLLGLAAVGVSFAVTVADELGHVAASEWLETLIVDAILFSLLGVAVWAVARWVRRSRRDLSDLELRRRAAARSAVAEERLRIALELHDIVANSVTVIVLQAAGARRVSKNESPLVDRALADIEATGRQAMGELRRLLRLLGTSGIDGGELLDLEPHPGLADLPPVLDRLKAAGLILDVRHEGTPQPLDTSVDLTAHRVVTEGLTNALKHGGTGAHAVVLLQWQDGRLTVSVTDDGRGHRQTETQALSTQRGLLGLGERVRAVGGSLDYGHRTDGGFQVTATLPTAASPRTGGGDIEGDGRVRSRWPAITDDQEQ